VSRVKARLVLLLVTVAAVLASAGCGGGGESRSDPASLAPPKSPLFVEAAVQPQGSVKSNLEALAKNVAGIDDLGGLLVSKLESSASGSGQKIDFGREVQPWLGERAGIFFQRYDGNNFTGYGVVVQTTDAEAAQDFVAKQAKSSHDPVKSASYEGIDFKVQGPDGTSIGMVGEFLVVAEDEGAFKDAVDASKGESLAGVEAYSSAADAAPSGSIGDVYVDVGALIRQGGGSVDPQVLKVLKSAGVDPTEATALASVVPGSGQVEIDVSSDLGGQNLPSGDASSLLGSLPVGSFAALAVSGFGEQLEEALDGLDAEGIPGTIPPHQLKKGLKQAGVDLEGIVSSLEDAAAFAVGNDENSLGGALVMTAKDSRASEGIAKLTQLLTGLHVAGVSVVSGKASGFSIHSPELGHKPLVVVAKGKRIAIGYGLPPALQGLSTGSSRTLSDSPSYGEAVAALGSTPISGFVDGPAALRLAESLVPPAERGFQEAKPYLAKVGYIAIGSGRSGNLATAKLIVGFGK
jgi:Protein of unknown function (DUF3352)